MNCENSEELPIKAYTVLETRVSHFRISLMSLRDIRRRRASGVVGPNGLEPSTSRLSGVRSNHLSYEPISVAGRFHRPNLFAAATFRLAVVETNRIELSTPCLQGRCSPS